MYTYIYAEHLNKRKYENKLRIIEANLSAYGISGDVRRLSNFLPLEGIIREILRRKNQTVVGIGDDLLFFKLLNYLAKSKVILGFIPTETKSFYGDLLGIFKGDNACESLAARRVITVDLGFFDKQYFLSFARGKEDIAELAIECENFKIKTRKKFNFCLNNVGFGSNPFDGQIEALIFKKSVFVKKTAVYASIPVKECAIRAKNAVAIVLDGVASAALPAKAGVVANGLQIIVGRKRKF